MWQINVERDGKFVDTGIRISTDPNVWIEEHAGDLQCYAAVHANDGILADFKRGIASFIGVFK